MDPLAEQMPKKKPDTLALPLLTAAPGPKGDTNCPMDLPVTSKPPQPDPHAELWKSATKSASSISAVGIILSELAVVAIDDMEKMLHMPIECTVKSSKRFLSGAPSALKATMATEPFMGFDTLTTGTGQLPDGTKIVSFRNYSIQLGENGEIPSGFVLHGTVKPSGLFDAPLYILADS